MFERFSDKARRVVVRAQEEARGLHHNYIGTEHLLLALLDVTDGMAAHVLERFELTADGVRKEVTDIIGIGKKQMAGHIPFTPRAKKTLELALREALELHQNYIGTEHLLLGVIREGEGVGAQILKKHAASFEAIRLAVLDLMQTATARQARRSLAVRLAQPAGEPEGPGEQTAPPTTPAAETSLGEAARLAGRQRIGSHHLLLAALADPDTAAARTLASLGLDLDRAREALRDADVTGTSDEQPEDAGRRQMRIQVTGDRVTIEATDKAIIDLGRAAVEALGDQASPPGTIDGDLAVSASLSEVWLALEQSLEDIRRRARQPVPREAGPRGGAAAPAGDEPSAADQDAGAGGESGTEVA